MVEFRPLSLEEDRDFVLEMYIIMDFETASDAERRAGLNAFKQAWLDSTKGESTIGAIAASLLDQRTIADVITVNGVKAGFIWATFEVLPYELKYMELRMVAFKLNFQRQGLGRVAVHYVEELATERGAEAVRATGNASRESIVRFHASVGFQPIQTIFEKRLPQAAAAR